MLRELDSPVCGILSNMAGYRCPHCRKWSTPAFTLTSVKIVKPPTRAPDWPSGLVTALSTVAAVGRERGVPLDYLVA